MSLNKAFEFGFGGCLGVGCAVAVVFIAIPIGCLLLGVWGTIPNGDLEPGRMSGPIRPEELMASKSRTRQEEPVTSSNSRVHVTREQFGNEWPLTVDSGDVECIDGLYVVFHHHGTAYALNGIAESRGYPKIDPIWKDNEAFASMGIESKLNIQPLLDAGLELRPTR